MANHPLMLANGYQTVNGTAGMRSGTSGRLLSIDLADKLEGLLSNVAYMAHAMDIFDTGRSTVPFDGPGSKQFSHLCNTDGVQWTAYIYVFIRRAQRNGDLAAVQHGLASLIAVEQGIVDGRSTVETLAPGLVQMHDVRADDSERKRLDREAEALAAAS